MLLAVFFLCFFTASPSPTPPTRTSRRPNTWRFDAFNEGGSWNYGDIRWFERDRADDPGDKCHTIMKPNKNWGNELHPRTLEGVQAPRWYVKNRQTDDQRVQYIASRFPIVSGFQNDDEVRQNPTPVQPDTFKDWAGLHQLASIFCRDSTIDEVRMKRNMAAQKVYSCSIMQDLVRLCMTDSRVVLPDSFNRIFRETFDVVIPSEDEEVQFNARKTHMDLVEDNCSKLFKIESPIRTFFPKDIETWVRNWGRMVEGASKAGYEIIVWLEMDEVWRNMDVQPQVVTYTADKITKNAIDEIYNRNLYELPNKKKYWYFCCRQGATCNNI